MSLWFSKKSFKIIKVVKEIQFEIQPEKFTCISFDLQSS